MKKKAVISVTSRQIKDDDNDAIKVVTPGDFYKKENTYYAVYKETEISGMQGTTTTLKICDNKISLIRMGSTTTKMEFDEKKKCVSMYSTPYGTIELTIDTIKVKIDVDENGGNILINYNMSLAGQKPQYTKLIIDIKVQ